MESWSFIKVIVKKNKRQTYKTFIAIDECFVFNYM